MLLWLGQDGVLGVHCCLGCVSRLSTWGMERNGHLQCAIGCVKQQRNGGCRDGWSRCLHCRQLMEEDVKLVTRGMKET